MRFKMHLELRVKDKHEKALASKLKSEICSPCCGVDYHIKEALDRGVDMNSLFNLIEVGFGRYADSVGAVEASRTYSYGNDYGLDATFDASESYEFSRLRLFDSISQYLEDGSYLTINGKGVEVAGGKVEFI